MDGALIGVDFSCAPSRRKPITVAHGRLRRTKAGACLQLEALEAIETLAAFEAALARPGPWFGAFDFPFGLPRAFADELGLGTDTASVIAAVQRRCPTRMDFRRLVDAWGNARPAGQRLLHRRTDRALAGISSSSPLQTRYVPVGFMYYEGLSRLVRSGVTLPRLLEGDPSRQAIEAYPGLLAFELVGRRSYKNHPGDERRAARADILQALAGDRHRLQLRVACAAALRERLLDDSGGDLLDALLALVQAAWASTRPDGGMPADVDPVEGWIATAGLG